MEIIDESSILKPGKEIFDWSFKTAVMTEKLFLGTKIKPEFEKEQAKQIVQKLYGISTLEICELNSYDDRNFLVYADKWVNDSRSKEYWFLTDMCALFPGT